MSAAPVTPRRSGRASGLVDRLPRRLVEGVRRSYRTLLSLLPTKARLPAVRLELEHWLPCWVFRLLSVLLALGSAALVLSGTFGWLVVGVLAVLILIRPGSPAAPVLAAVLGFSLLQQPEQVWGLRGPLLLLGVHACIALSALIGVTSWTARVQLRVLASPLGRFAVIQLVAQVIGVLGALLAGRELSWPWVPVVAALAVLALAWVWVPRLGRRETPPPSQIEHVFGSVARRWGDE